MAPRDPVAAASKWSRSERFYNDGTQWAEAAGLRFGLLIHHTDAKREWAYDRESHIGALIRTLDEAPRRGWTVVDMQRDWKVIYPFQK
jgi:hypothetical protein